MLWVKAFHVIFMVTWFAGLFYLPRLFVYHAQTDDTVSLQRFIVMERKLFAIMTMGAIVATALGLWLLSDYAWAVYGTTLWLPLKLVLAAGLVIYHGYCYVLLKNFAQGRNRHSHVFYRWVNEIPALILLAMVILVTVKPF